MQPHPSQPPQVDVQQHNARARKDSLSHSGWQRRRRNCRDECRESGASYRQRNAHRCATRRISTTPVTKRRHARDKPPVTTNRTACERPSQLKRVNSASVERTTTLRLRTSGAAVHASLAPAQPPPPAGLASGPACITKSLDVYCGVPGADTFCSTCSISTRVGQSGSSRENAFAMDERSRLQS